MKFIPPLLCAAVLSGCGFAPGAFTASAKNAASVQGPPIEDVVTSFDDALTCLRGKIPKEVVFAVGQVIDATGKETFADGGTGKFVTQGAGEMVQSALFRSGVSVVNRRDPQISLVEANWGIRDIRRQVPVNFFVSGSINSLDFIPGGGFSAQLGGIGPRYRQNRILVAIDLTLTDAYTGRIVASVPLQKQIFTTEYGGVANTFFGSTLVQFEAGGMQREALHFALRQMLSLATIELVGQLMQPEVFGECRNLVEAKNGFVGSTGTADPYALAAAMRLVKEVEDGSYAPDLAIPASTPTPQEAAAQQAAATGTVEQPQQQQAQASPEAQAAAANVTRANQIGKLSTSAATEAIRAASQSENAPMRKEAMTLAAFALQKSNDALRLLQQAAAEGFGGDEGEVAAVVVQQALLGAQKAGRAAAERDADNAAVVAPERATSTSGVSPAAPAPGAASTAPTAADIARGAMDALGRVESE